MNDNKKLAVFALASATLYVLLYFFAADILRLTARGGIYFVIPVGIAFVFSYVHGVFTALFWEVLGLKAKKHRI